MAKDPLQPERCAKLLAALAALERLRIVRFLADGPHTVTGNATALTGRPWFYLKVKQTTFEQLPPALFSDLLAAGADE